MYKGSRDFIPHPSKMYSQHVLNKTKVRLTKQGREELPEEETRLRGLESCTLTDLRNSGQKQ